MKKSLKKFLVCILSGISILCMACVGVLSVNKDATVSRADVVAEKQNMTVKEGESQAITDSPVKMDGLKVTISSSVTLTDSRFGVAFTSESGSTFLNLIVDIKNGWGQHRLYVDSADIAKPGDTSISDNTIAYTDPNATGGPQPGIQTGAGLMDCCLVSSSTTAEKYTYSFLFYYEGQHSSGAYEYWSLQMSVVEGSNPFGGEQWRTTKAYLLHDATSMGVNGKGAVNITARNYASSQTNYFDNTTFSVTVDEKPEIDNALSVYRRAKEAGNDSTAIEARKTLLDMLSTMSETDQATYMAQLEEIDVEEYRWIARPDTATLAPSYNVEKGHTTLKPITWGQGYTYAKAVELDGLSVIFGSDSHVARSRFGFGLVKNTGDYAPAMNTVNFTMVPQYSQFTGTEIWQDSLFICENHSETNNGAYLDPYTILYRDENCQENYLCEVDAAQISYFPSISTENTTYGITFNKCDNGNYKVTIRLLEGKVYGVQEVVAYLPATQLTDVLAADGTCYISVWGMDLQSANPFYVEVKERAYATTYAEMTDAKDAYETAIRQGTDDDTLNELKQAYERTFESLSIYNYISALGDSTELTKLCELMNGLLQNASLTLQESLTLNYKLTIPNEILGELNAISVIVNVGDETFTYDVSKFKNVDGKWVCPIVELGPQWMTENISVETVATDSTGDMLFERSVGGYSLKAYCDALLSDSSASAVLKTAVADLLNYGAAAQQYVNRNTDKLANEGLDQSLATTANPEEGAQDILAVNQGTAVTFTAVTAHLEDTVTAYAKFRYTGTGNLRAMVAVGGGTQTEVTVHEISNGYYYVESSALTPLQFDEEIVFSIYVGNARNAQCRFSVNSYIRRNYSHEKAGALITALYKYSVGVSAYAETLPVNKLADENFENGFAVYDPTENTNTLTKTFATVNSSATPSWKVYQWASKYNLGTVGTATSSNGVYTISDSSKKIELNSVDDTIYLELNADAEYGNTDRKNNESWPHLLLQQDYSGNDLLRLADQSSLCMQMDYTITKCDDRMNGEVDKSLHCAQFVWYVTLQNRNKESADYGQYMWFGILLFDNRNVGLVVNTYNAADGGKAVATNAMIYQPGTADWAPNGVSPAVGQAVSLNLDIIPLAKAAFETAKANSANETNGAFKNTTWEDLYIGSTNLGFELPGTYNIGVRISKLGLVASRNATILTPQVKA